MLRELVYPFLVYRSILVPFLVVSAVAVPCWLGFRLFRLRAARERPWFRRESLLLILVLYLSGLAAATLGPNHGSRLRGEAAAGVELRPSLATLTCRPSATLPSGSNDHFFCMYNARGNVLLFVPLGFLIPLIWTRRRSRSVILIAIALSGGIEIVQYLSRAWGSYRLADINDVVLNVVGACLGLGGVSLLRMLRRGIRTAVQRA